MAYDINSIESLSFREGVRTRIQMYLGSDDNEGTYQALKEIINNKIIKKYNIKTITLKDLVFIDKPLYNSFSVILPSPFKSI